MLNLYSKERINLYLCKLLYPYTYNVIIFSYLAQATTSHTEEQSLVNNVPITDNDNIVSKLSEKCEQVIGTTSSSVEKNKKEHTVSEETTKNVSVKSPTRLECEPHDTITDSSSTQPTTQKSLEKVAEEACRSLLFRGAPQEITIPLVPCDLVHSCSIEEQKVELLCNKDNVCFVTATEELTSNITNLTNLEIAIDTQQIKQPNIQDEKHANELSTASEILTVSPVPIQVAESVLQVEPKESLSDSQIMTEEVLSSTITPVHESNVPCFETDEENKVQVNGSTSAIDSIQNKEKLDSDIIDTVEKSIESPTKVETSQILSPVEQPQLTETPTLSLSMTESTETCANKDVQVAKSIQQIDKTESGIKESIEPVQEIKEIESCTKQTTEPVQQTKETGGCTKETTEVVQQIKEIESCTKETTESSKSSVECEVAKTSASRESPVRPSRAKELNVSSKSVPETPQDLKGQEKVTKKTVKKSSEKLVLETDPIETTEGDSTGKKGVKKVVKKVAKKSKSKPEEGLDDGIEDSSSLSKQKKTVKVVKKGIKSSQTPDTDTTTSELPSSSTSDTPVPPKRKTKPTVTKPVVKKSDVE